ncbi:MAG: hypothetical protein ACLUVD_07075 [Mediterraneibacter faecis]
MMRNLYENDLQLFQDREMPETGTGLISACMTMPAIHWESSTAHRQPSNMPLARTEFG